MVNLKKTLIDELLALTLDMWFDKDETQKNINYEEYKMHLYTLSTNQLLDSLEYEKSKQYITLCN